VRSRKLIAGVAFCLIGTSNGYALGLGDIELNSVLNQPLDAEIGLLSVTPDEATGISARLADTMAFAAAGIDRTALLTRLNFQVVTDATGVTVVRVTTSERVREPFLNFIVEVNWPSGRLLREYTVLVDPPVVVSERPIGGSAEDAATRPPQRVESAPQAAGHAAAVAATSPRMPANGNPATNQRPAAPGDALPANVAVQGTYGPIARNETLWDVAEATRPGTQVSVEQMMIALYNANPDAFIDDNINNLKAGHVLRLPDPSAVAVITQAQARREARAHYSRWTEARKTAPPAVDTSVAVVEPAEQGADEAGHAVTIVRMESTEPQSAQASQEAMLATVGGDANAERELEAVRAELQRALQEAESARQERGNLVNQLATAKEQITAMERSLNLMERLLNLNGHDLVTLQNMLDRLPDQAGQAKSASAPIAPDSGPVAALEHQGGFSLSMPASVLGSAVAVLLLGALGWTVVRRRRVAAGAYIDELRAHLAGSTDRSAPSVDSPAQAPVAAPSPLAQSAPVAEPPSEGGVGSIPATHHKESEVVPVAEVEGLIREALRAKPERGDLQLKLLEILYGAGNKEGFEAQAEELYLVLGGEDSGTWSKVKAMGAELCPDHRLFGDAAAGTAHAAEASAGADASQGPDAATEESAGRTTDGIHEELQWQFAEDESPAGASGSQSESENTEPDGSTIVDGELADTVADLRMREGDEEPASESTVTQESSETLEDALQEALQDALQRETDGSPEVSEPKPGDTTQVVRGTGFGAATAHGAEHNGSFDQETMDLDTMTSGSLREDEETVEVEQGAAEGSGSAVTPPSDQSDGDSVASPDDQGLERKRKNFR
jgi:pilus assembly protein FimV